MDFAQNLQETVFINLKKYFKWGRYQIKPMKPEEGYIYNILYKSYANMKIGSHQLWIRWVLSGCSIILSPQTHWHPKLFSSDSPTFLSMTVKPKALSLFSLCVYCGLFCSNFCLLRVKALATCASNWNDRKKLSTRAGIYLPVDRK